MTPDTEPLILAADAGGTKTNLALVPALGKGRIGSPASLESYRSADFPSLEAMIDAFRKRHPAPLAGVSIGFAGPVAGGRGAGTHVPWVVEERVIARQLGLPRVHVINDLVAAGFGVPALSPRDLVPIVPGVPDPEGNAAIVSAGTGLGETTLLRHDGELWPVASEGGHADFAARTDLEIEILRALRARFGRVSVERVLSGIGLANIALVIHELEGAAATMAEHEAEAAASDAVELPAVISKHALAGSCRSCARSLETMVSVYGAQAGNTALRGMATAGVYLGGGIPPRILPALTGPAFRDAFLAKEPHRGLLEKIPVWVVTNEHLSVLGAARYATLAGACPP
ncbi:MAG TPA: glucokinase [Candidatus Eisenbacteria bacterium]|nr:glucokinase [Candidatus Eisenbacteria bacterium]